MNMHMFLAMLQAVKRITRKDFVSHGSLVYASEKMVFAKVMIRSSENELYKRNRQDNN